MNDTVVDTVTVNDCMALSPPGSVAVTRIVALPSPTVVSVITRAPVARAATTRGADDDTL